MRRKEEKSDIDSKRMLEYKICVYIIEIDHHDDLN